MTSRAAVVEPVHAPPLHVPAAQAQGVPHRSVTSQVCSAETPEHRDTPGVQLPPSAPPLLPLPVLEPPLLELAVPELLDPELPPDPELLLLAVGVESAELPSPKLLPAPDPSGSAAKVAELPSTPLPVLDSGLPPPELLPPPDSDRLDAESGGPGPLFIDLATASHKGESSGPNQRNAAHDPDGTRRGHPTKRRQAFGKRRRSRSRRRTSRSRRRSQPHRPATGSSRRRRRTWWRPARRMGASSRAPP